jgi:hypothetical protein
MAYEKDSETGKLKNLMACPVCSKDFSSLPDDITLFDCGFCRNRLYVRKLKPALAWNMLFSPHALHIFHIYLAKPDSLRARKIVTYSEIWKENRNNLTIVSLMSFLGVLYAIFAVYMEKHGSTSIIFTNPFFSGIPLAIAFWYYLAYERQNRKFLVYPIPVIKPDSEAMKGHDDEK